MVLNYGDNKTHLLLTVARCVPLFSVTCVSLCSLGAPGEVDEE